MDLEVQPGLIVLQEQRGPGNTNHMRTAAGRQPDRAALSGAPTRGAAGPTLHNTLMALFHYTFPARLASTRLASARFLFHYKKYLLNVGGVVIARRCETA